MAEKIIILRNGAHQILKQHPISLLVGFCIHVIDGVCRGASLVALLRPAEDSLLEDLSPGLLATS